MGPKLEDYEVIDIIGQGSHGTIKKVKRKTDGQLLVWKEVHYASMSEAEKQGLVLEVNLLRELHHSNIVKFFNHHVDRRSGILFIFMEYCPGGDLRHLVNKCCKTGSFLEEGFIWRVLKQVTEALKVCHENETNNGVIILHRDIKPANVFLDKDGNIKLGDFGLARTLNSNASFARTFVGTPYYMSPEVIAGRDYNERSDIWSLGCLIYELCALEPPFKAANQSELYEKIKLGRFKRIPMHYSNSLWEIIQELLTQEDFLRPSAFMILHNPALNANTVKEEKLVDSLSLSLSLSLNHPNQSKSIQDSTDEGQSSSASSLAETVKEKVMCAEEKKMEESLMREVEAMLLESKQRKERERLARLEGTSELSVDLLDLPAGQDLRGARKSNKELDPETKERSPKVLQSFKDRTEERILFAPKCVCGGTTLEEWRERVSLVRAAEAAVKERELALEERERELIKREHKLNVMEQEVKQHMVRAQIYLKQCRSKGPTVPYPPKFTQRENTSDFDATTVSADIGYDDRPTIAFIDTQPQNNPFLKMRESFNRKHNIIKNANLSKSNTLDNPKSRRKHGNYFYLEKGSDNLTEKKESLATEQEENPTTFNNKHNTYRDDRSSIAPYPENNPKGGLKNTKIPNLKNNHKDKHVVKGNSGNILSTLRQNFVRNSRKRTSAKYGQLDKENRVEETNIEPFLSTQLERKPLGVINCKQFQVKRTSAKPDRNILPVKAKPLGVQQASSQNSHREGPIFRYYNAV